MRRKRHQNNGRSSGQTMLEAIIASGIIVTAVGAALTLVYSSIAAAKESESRLVATNLAREGVEVVRAIRDSNWLAGDDWDDGLEGPSNDYSGILVFNASGKSWAVDFSPADIDDPETKVYRQAVAGGPEQPGLMLQGIPQPAGTDETVFRRIVHLKALCSTVVGSTPNFIAYEAKDDGEACLTEKIGIEVRSEAGWIGAGDSLHMVSAVERIFDWR